MVMVSEFVDVRLLSVQWASLPVEKLFYDGIILIHLQGVSWH